MNTYLKLSLSIIVIVLLLYSNTVSARQTNYNLGKALVTGSSDAIAEVNSNYNAFQVGQFVDSPPKTNYTSMESLKRIMGDVNPDTAMKVGWNFHDYYHRRDKTKTMTGKYFEAKYAHDFNIRSSKYELISTAYKKHSQDIADLLLRNKETGQIEMKIQQKLSTEEAIKAIGNPKYRDCIILIPPDELAKIKCELPTYRSKNKNLIEQAITDGILTDNVHGYFAKSSNYYIQKVQSEYSPIFQKTKKEFNQLFAKAIRNEKTKFYYNSKPYRTQKVINAYQSTRSIPKINNALRFAKHAKFVKVGNNVVGVASSIIDIGYGGYMIYNAESQFEKGLLDADLSNYKKILGGVQITVGIVGMVAVFIPQISPFVTPVVIVVGVTIVALDMWIDHIQAQRVAARRRLLERVITHAEPAAIHQLLLREMEIQCAL